MSIISSLSKRNKIVLAVIVGLTVILGSAFAVSAITGQGLGILADQLSSSTGTVELTLTDPDENVLPGVDVHLFNVKPKNSNEPVLVDSKKTNDSGKATFRNVLYREGEFNHYNFCYGYNKVASTCHQDGLPTFYVNRPFVSHKQFFNPQNTPISDVRPTVYGKVFDERTTELEGGQVDIFKGSNCSDQSKYIGGERVQKDQHTLPNGQKASFWARDLQPSQQYCFAFSRFNGYGDKNVVYETEPYSKYQDLLVHLTTTDASTFNLIGTIRTHLGLVGDAKVEIRTERNGPVLYETTSEIWEIPGEPANVNYKIENIPALRVGSRTNYYYITVSHHSIRQQTVALRDNQIRMPTTWQSFNLEYADDGQPEATISGRITKKLNPGSFPAGQAKVFCQQQNFTFGIGYTTWRNIADTLTDANGDYTIELSGGMNDENGRPDVGWNKDTRIIAKVQRNNNYFVGYYPSSNPAFRISAGENITHADIEVDARFTGIEGFVTKAEDGQPLANAQITIKPKKKEDLQYIPHGQSETTVKTNGEGRYQIPNMQSEIWYQIKASYPTENPEENRTTVVQYTYLGNKQVRQIDFRLAKNPNCKYEGRVEGFVYNQEGDPISDATVMINTRSMADNGAHPSVKSITTDSTGYYNLSLEGREIARDDVIYVKVVGDSIADDEDAKQRIKLPSCNPVYWLDFEVNNPTRERWPKRKDVEIQLIKKYRVGNRTIKAPIQSARVWLEDKGRNKGVSSGFTYLTSPQYTDSNGKTVFRDVPKVFTYRVKISNIDNNYIIRQPSQLIVARAERQKTIQLDYESIDLPYVWDKIYDRQNDPDWAGDWPSDFREGPLGSQGCCITSVCMALKYYYPTENPEPPDFLLANSNQGLMTVERARQFISYIEKKPYAQASVKVSQKVRGTAGIRKVKRALRKGYPVVGFAKPGGWDGHGYHCVLLVAYSGDTFTVLDPFPLSRGSGNWNNNYTLKEGKFEWALIFSPRNGDMISIQPFSDAQTKGGQETINQNQSLTVDSDITIQSIAEPQRVVLRVRQAGQRVQTYPMSKRGRFYRAKIPGFKNQVDFKYQVKVFSTFGNKDSTKWQTVKVQSDKSITSQVRNLTSKASYSIVNNKITDWVNRQYLGLKIKYSN